MNKVKNKRCATPPTQLLRVKACTTCPPSPFSYLKAFLMVIFPLLYVYRYILGIKLCINYIINKNK